MPAGAARVALFAATSGHSGVDRVIGNLARQFAAWGLRVDVLKLRGHGPEIALDNSQPARLVDLGAGHVQTALPALMRYLRRARPDALLTDKDRVNRLAILARLLTGVETRHLVRLGTAVSVNLASRGRLTRQVQRLSMRHLYPHAHGVIVPARAAAADLATFAGLDPARIRVLPSPIVATPIETAAPLVSLVPPHPWLATGGPPTILGIGELSARKDHATLIRAFARVRQRRSCRLLILGRGRQHAALQALASSLGVADAVALPGFVPNPQAFLRAARLFVLASRWEGLPVALIEALAAGTPAVTTDCPTGPAEILTDDTCGSLVPVGDVPAMAAAIEAWLDRPRPPPAAFARLVAPYRIETAAAAYLEALGLSERAPSGPATGAAVSPDLCEESPTC